jgi:hypothetical protein
MQMAAENPKKISVVWQCWQAHRARVVGAMEPLVLGEIEEAIIDGIEARAGREPKGRIAALHADLVALLRLPDLHQRPDDLQRTRQVYAEARKLTFPAAAAFTRHSQELSGLTTNASLRAVERDVLLDIDLLAHEDGTYATFVADMVAKLDSVTSAPDAVAYSQFFEIYAEAMVLRFLRGRGIATSRVADTVSAPDFECRLEDDRSYFVEVKALEIVDGKFRHNEIMADGLEPNIEIEKQIAAGKRIAMATGELAPYRKAFGAGDYDHASLKVVIDTLRDKCRQAFKSSQFKRGPTFALVVADRLILDGWSSSLVPYYFDEHHSACVSGVLWHAAFGTAGAPVLRLPDFEGKPGVEGHLGCAGLYADAARPFPGQGLVVLQRSSSKRLSYGLKAPVGDGDAWGTDDSEEALDAMCDAWNDEGNSRGFSLSRYKIE